MSQDDRMQSIGQYTFGQNINVRRGKWIELARKPEQLSTNAVGVAANAITSSLKTLLGNDTYYGTKAGEIEVSRDGGMTV